jgi:hypothetical protein
MYGDLAMTKYQVKDQNLDDFDIESFEVEDKEKTKNRLALYMFYVCVLFLGGAAIYGVVLGNFDSLKLVYEHVNPQMSLILGYYFGSKNG